jgi:hypothetical protein
VSAREVVREVDGYDPIACGRGVRLDAQWMDSVLVPLGGRACDLCGDPRAKPQLVQINDEHGMKLDKVEMALCSRGCMGRQGA